MGLWVQKLGGLALAVACFWWAATGDHRRAGATALIWAAPLAVYPLSFAGRWLLDARPTAGGAERVNIPAHYGVGIALGVGMFPALGRLFAVPPIQTPGLREAAAVLVWVTGAAAAFTVFNLAVRGLGLPFALKLSSRLATDWMYGWTRNPMGLASACWLAAMGLERASGWFLLWLAVCPCPAWVYFAKVYEERELELRFGREYVEYRRRTPMFLPRRPKAHND